MVCSINSIMSIAGKYSRKEVTVELQHTASLQWCNRQTEMCYHTINGHRILLVNSRTVQRITKSFWLLSELCISLGTRQTQRLGLLKRRWSLKGESGGRSSGSGGLDLLQIRWVWRRGAEEKHHDGRGIQETQLCKSEDITDYCFKCNPVTSLTTMFQ